MPQTTTNGPVRGDEPPGPLLEPQVGQRTNGEPYLHTDTRDLRLPPELWGEILLQATHIPYEFEEFPSSCGLSVDTRHWVYSRWKQTLPIRKIIVLVSRFWRDIGEKFLYQTAFIGSVPSLQSFISALRTSPQRACWVKRISIGSHFSSLSLNQQLGEILNESNNLLVYQDESTSFSFPLSPTPTPTNYLRLRCILLRSPIERFWSALPLFVNLEVLRLSNITIDHVVDVVFPPVSLPHLHFIELRFFGSTRAEYDLFNVWVPTWKAPKLKTLIVDADNMEILAGIEAHSATLANLGLTGSPLQPPSSPTSPSPTKFRTTSLRRVLAFHNFGTSSWRHLDGCIPLHDVREIELRLEESLGPAVVMASGYGWGSSLQDLLDLFTLICDKTRTPSLSQVIVSICPEDMTVIDITVRGVFNSWIQEMEKTRPGVRLKMSFGLDDDGNERTHDMCSVDLRSKLGSPGLTTSSVSF